MRMWMVPTNMMCNKHLLGEHVECHMFVGTILKKKSVEGYVKNNLLEVSSLKERHDALAEEMVKRGMNHKSELLNFDCSYLNEHEKNYIVDSDRSLNDLISRCDECKSNHLIKISNKIHFRVLMDVRVVKINVKSINQKDKSNGN